VVVWAVLGGSVGEFLGGLFGFIAFLGVVGGARLLDAAADFLLALRDLL
jgi:hypothetical protein